jgi:outer membrane protein assembly factor BamB
MRAATYRTTTIILLTIFALTGIKAQNWPCWRGPNGDGTSNETNVPVSWDSVTNVKWRVDVPGTGYSSPVVWNDRIFLTSALTDTKEKVLFCFDAGSGKLLWQKTVLKTAFENKHNDNSYASGTPATDGTKIYLSFLDGKDVLVAAYDFTGKQVWSQKPGTFASPHGYSCSPVLFKDMVLINGDSQGDSFVAALSKNDGHVVWKVSHPRPSHSFSTPILRNMAGKMQLIFCGNREIAGYNPDNGTKYWFVSGPSEDFCSSPVYNEKSGLILVSSAWPVRNLYAVRPDGKGDVTKTHVAWQTKKGAYYVPSPVCTDDYLFTTMTTGELHCIEIATGKIVWTQPNGAQYSSSVLVNNLVYMPNDEGTITVLKPGPSFNVVSKNKMGEKMFASPAISKGRIYIRTLSHLFCIVKN